MDRSDEKFILEMEVSDIIFKQHTNTYIPLDIVICTLQTIIIVVGLILQIVFKENTELTHIIAYFQMIVCLLLCILVVINNKITSRAWNKAKKDYKELFDIMDDCFKPNYSVDDQTKMIHRIAKYKEKRRLKGSHFKK